MCAQAGKEVVYKGQMLNEEQMFLVGGVGGGGREVTVLQLTQHENIWHQSWARNLMASLFWTVYLKNIIHIEYIIFMKKTIKLSILNMHREEKIFLDNLLYL